MIIEEGDLFMFDVKEISIRNMFLYALIRWRLIVIGVLIFAILSPTVMYNNDRRKADEMKSETEEDDNESQISISGLEASVKSLADAYRQYDQIENQLKPIENLELERGTLRYACVHFFIGLDEEQKAKLGSIEPFYSSYVKGDDFINALTDIMGTEIDPAVLRKYIMVTCKDTNLIIEIPCSSDTDLEKFLSVMKEMILSKMGEYQTSVKHKLQPVYEGSKEEKNATLLQELNEYDTRKNTANSLITNYAKTMTDYQVEIAKKLANGDINEDKVSELLKAESNEKVIGVETTDDVSDFGIKYVVKNAVRGAIIGLFFMITLLCAVYVISGKLHSVKELSKRGGMVIIGVLDYPTVDYSKNKLDKLIIRLLRSDRRHLNHKQQINEIVASISLLLARRDIKKICFTTSLYDKEYLVTMEELVNSCKSKGLETSFADDIVYNKDSLLVRSDTEGLILVERVCHSLLSDVENEIMTARGYDIPVLGAIVLE